MGVPHVTTADGLAGADAVIIGAPYVATTEDEYAGVHKDHWIAGPKRVRQQSERIWDCPPPRRGGVCPNKQEP